MPPRWNPSSGALAGLCCLALNACSNGHSAPPTLTAPEGTVYAANGSVEYQPGTLPFIVCAPHGGLLLPETIADRPDSDALNDAHTQELARLVAAALREGGARPHLIINLLHRTKLDANRPLDEATAGDPVAEQAWAAYHGFIEQARDEAIGQHGRGLLLDVHGHSHEFPRVELGYLLSSQDLDLEGDALEELAAQSSVHNLAEASPLPFAELIRGASSLGADLADAGYPTVPSPRYPSPNGLPYFIGGYTLRRHSSGASDSVDAIQLEAPKLGVRDTRLHRITFATVVAAALRHTFDLAP
jgi:hypothetical protein